jgi:flagellar biosynthesis/type III secretory pathway ATPase
MAKTTKKEYAKREEFQEKIRISKHQGGPPSLIDEAPELIEHIEDWMKARTERRSMSGIKKVCEILNELYPEHWTPSTTALRRWLEKNHKESWEKIKRMKST